MSAGRARILAAVSRALGRNTPPAPETVSAERARRLPPDVPRPVWTESLRERFTSRLVAAAGTWETLPGPERVPEAVVRYLGDRTDPRLRIGAHPLLQGLHWPEGWTVADGPDDAAAWPAALGVAYAGIAETGSVVFPSGPTRPTSLNFLPDYHVAVLSATDIVAYMEAVWERLLADGGMPRAVNVITGPSRTADVEQTLQLGAHGPRHLHVLLLDSEPPRAGQAPT